MYFPRCYNPIGIFPDKNKPINPIYVPCGKCIACKITRANTWAMRSLMEYHYQDKQGVFLTLTYDDDHLPLGLSKRDFQLFLKSFRRDLDLQGVKIRYFGCGEYGENTFRPHYHFLIFGINEKNPLFIDIREQLQNGRRGYLRSWSKGLVHLGYVSPQSAAYVAKYCLKASETSIGAKRRSTSRSEHLIEKPFQLMSRRPALGDGYMLRHYQRILDGNDPIVRFTSIDESRTPSLPRFVRERCELYQRLYSDNGIEVLALQELRKEKRIEFVQKSIAKLESVELANYQRSLNFESMVNKRGVL